MSAAALTGGESVCEIVFLEVTGHAIYGISVVPHRLAGRDGHVDELRALARSYPPGYGPLLLAAQAAATRPTRVAV